MILFIVYLCREAIVYWKTRIYMKLDFLNIELDNKRNISRLFTIHKGKGWSSVGGMNAVNVYLYIGAQLYLLPPTILQSSALIRTQAENECRMKAPRTKAPKTQVRLAFVSLLSVGLSSEIHISTFSASTHSSWKCIDFYAYKLRIRTIFFK